MITRNPFVRAPGCTRQGLCLVGESCRVARLHDGRNLSPAGDLRTNLAGERGKQNPVAELARGHELAGAVSTGAVPEDGQVVRGSGAGADVRL